jgi:hypothetical protein
MLAAPIYGDNSWDRGSFAEFPLDFNALGDFPEKPT